MLVPAREIDRDSLILLMERATGCSPVKRAKQINRINKAYRRGELYIPPDENETQRWWRAEARMMLGDFSDWRGWEYRDEWAATLWHHKDTIPFPKPPWDGLKTACLYVIGEQGIGDEVFFSGCLHEALNRSERVIVECQPRLRSVFERSFKVETIPSNIEGTKRTKRELPKEVTAWIPMGDLPRMWRGAVRHFPRKPYLTADPEQVERFSRYKGRAGISWRGAQGVEKHIVESFPEAVSLQYDPEWDDPDVERPELDQLNDIEGLLGLLANLERVVTVSTSVAHFSAALGLETHVIIADHTTGRRASILPWKWLCKATPNSTPWYSEKTRTYRNWSEFASLGMVPLPKVRAGANR